MRSKIWYCLLFVVFLTCVGCDEKSPNDKYHEGIVASVTFESDCNEYEYAIFTMENKEMIRLHQSKSKPFAVKIGAVNRIYYNTAGHITDIEYQADKY
jgi:hypothetical protein